MNFSGETDREKMAVELKYCERCGGLFLRAPGQSLVHCGACRAQLAERAAAARTIPGWKGQPGARKKKKARRLGEVQGAGQIENLHGVASQAVLS